MTFESVNNQNKVPIRGDDIYKKRNVFKFVVKTWLETQDANWFDKEEIYKQTESSLILRLNSKSDGQKQDLVCKYFSIFLCNQS